MRVSRCAAWRGGCCGAGRACTARQRGACGARARLQQDLDDVLTLVGAVVVQQHAVVGRLLGLLLLLLAAERGRAAHAPRRLRSCLACGLRGYPSAPPPLRKAAPEVELALAAWRRLRGRWSVQHVAATTPGACRRSDNGACAAQRRHGGRPARHGSACAQARRAVCAGCGARRGAARCQHRCARWHRASAAQQRHAGVPSGAQMGRRCASALVRRLCGVNSGRRGGDAMCLDCHVSESARPLWSSIPPSCPR